MNISRKQFEIFAKEFGMILDRSKHYPERYKYQQAADAWKAWQRAFKEDTLEEDLKILRQEVQDQASLKDHYQEWEKTEDLFTSLLEKVTIEC